MIKGKFYFANRGAVGHLGGYGVQSLLAGDDEADHAGPAALPHHEDVLHRGVGQQTALNL